MNVSKELVRWLACGERGMSSNTMVTHLTGIQADPDEWGKAYPHDPADLNRCRKLLEEVPELQSELHRMASCSPEWAALVSEWQSLCEMMDEEAPHWRVGRGSARKTYDRMRTLTDTARKQAQPPKDTPL